MTLLIHFEMFRKIYDIYQKLILTFELDIVKGLCDSIRYMYVVYGNGNFLLGARLPESMCAS